MDIFDIPYYVIKHFIFLYLQYIYFVGVCSFEGHERHITEITHVLVGYMSEKHALMLPITPAGIEPHGYDKKFDCVSFEKVIYVSVITF